MKLLFQILLVLFGSTSSFSQTDTISHRRELNLQILDGNAQTVITFKKKLSGNAFYRIAAGVGYLNFGFSNLNTSQSGQKRYRHTISLRVGKEWRNLLDNNFWFCQGIQGLVNSEVNIRFKNTNEVQSQMSLGFGYILGFLFDVNSRWAISFETIPSIIFSQTISENTGQGEFGLTVVGSNFLGFSAVRKF